MLTNTLNTNEIKDSSAVEREFTRLSVGDRQTVYAQIAESYGLPNRLSIKHTETGVGLKLRRRTLIRFDKTVNGEVVEAEPCTTSIYLVADLPVGNLLTGVVVKDVLAYMNSFMASLGASTTILYDGTGNGSQIVLTGGI